jgi:membrane protein required for colicin V production
MRNTLADFLHWKPNTIQTIAFVLTFILVVIGVTFIAKILTGIADLAFLGWINWVVAFRVLKTVLILGTLLRYSKMNYNNILAKKETLDQSLLQSIKKRQFFYPSKKMVRRAQR